MKPDRGKFKSLPDWRIKTKCKNYSIIPVAFGSIEPPFYILHCTASPINGRTAKTPSSIRIETQRGRMAGARRTDGRNGCRILQSKQIQERARFFSAILEAFSSDELTNVQPATARTSRVRWMVDGPRGGGPPQKGRKKRIGSIGTRARQQQQQQRTITQNLSHTKNPPASSHRQLLIGFISTANTLQHKTPALFDSAERTQSFRTTPERGRTIFQSQKATRNGNENFTFILK